MNVSKIDIDELIVNMDKEEKFLYDVADSQYRLIKNLISERKAQNLTQGDIAKASGMTQQAVSRIEKFGNSPSLSNLIKYMMVIGLDINDIFNLNKKVKNKIN